MPVLSENPTNKRFIKLFFECFYDMRNMELPMFGIEILRIGQDFDIYTWDL